MKKRFGFALFVVVLILGVCWNPSHLPSQVADAEYDVYRAFLQSQARPFVVEDHTDGARVQLCVYLSKYDKNLLWELVRLEGKTFPLDARRLGAAAAPSSPYQRVRFTRVALGGGSQVGVLQVSVAECDKACGPERSEVFTASKSGGAWSFRSSGCVQTRR